MSAFHSGPWLKLISRRRSADSGSSKMGLCRSRQRYFPAVDAAPLRRLTQIE
jgi:hypothetical protein